MWWMDLTPYPGPSEHQERLDFLDQLEQVKKSFSKLSVAAAAAGSLVSKRMGKSLAMAAAVEEQRAREKILGKGDLHIQITCLPQTWDLARPDKP